MGTLPIGEPGNPGSHTQTLPQATCEERQGLSSLCGALTRAWMRVHAWPKLPLSQLSPPKCSPHPGPANGTQGPDQASPRLRTQSPTTTQHTYSLWIIRGSPAIRRPSRVLLPEPTCRQSPTYLLPDHVPGCNYPPARPHPFAPPRAPVACWSPRHLPETGF